MLRSYYYCCLGAESMAIFRSLKRAGAFDLGARAHDFMSYILLLLLCQIYTAILVIRQCPVTSDNWSAEN
jgi:hypothetical protein